MTPEITDFLQPSSNLVCEFNPILCDMIQNSENQSENQMFNFSFSGLVNEEKGENPKAGSIEVSGGE